MAQKTDEQKTAAQKAAEFNQNELNQVSRDIVRAARQSEPKGNDL